MVVVLIIDGCSQLAQQQRAVDEAPHANVTESVVFKLDVRLSKPFKHRRR